MTKLAEELRDCDDDELEVRLENARKELFNLRFQVATGRLDNVARIEQVRRSVARILTVQRSREIEAADALESGLPAPVHLARRPAASSASPAEETAGSTDEAADLGSRSRRRRRGAEAEATEDGALDDSAAELEEEEVDGEDAGHLEGAGAADV